MCKYLKIFQQRSFKTINFLFFLLFLHFFLLFFLISFLILFFFLPFFVSLLLSLYILSSITSPDICFVIHLERTSRIKPYGYRWVKAYPSSFPISWFGLTYLSNRCLWLPGKQLGLIPSKVTENPVYAHLWSHVPSVMHPSLAPLVRKATRKSRNITGKTRFLLPHSVTGFWFCLSC